MKELKDEGWMNKYMNELKDERLKRWKNEYLSTWMNEWKDEKMNIWMIGGTNDLGWKMKW